MSNIPIPVTHCLVLSAIIFSVSIAGIIINRRNLLILLMSIELMLLAVSTNFITFTNMLNQNTGSVFVFFILTVAAAESAVGLAIIVFLFRSRNTIDVNQINTLKG